MTERKKCEMFLMFALWIFEIWGNYEQIRLDKIVIVKLFL